MGSNNFVLTPGRYVGAADQEEGREPFPQKMERLVAQLRQQQSEAAHLGAAIIANPGALGFGKGKAQPPSSPV